MVNMNRISVRYAAMFSAIAIIFVISAVINADRDLYQEKVLE